MIEGYHSLGNTRRTSEGEKFRRLLVEYRWNRSGETESPRNRRLFYPFFCQTPDEISVFSTTPAQSRLAAGEAGLGCKIRKIPTFGKLGLVPSAGTTSNPAPAATLPKQTSAN